MRHRVKELGNLKGINFENGVLKVTGYNYSADSISAHGVDFDALLSSPQLVEVDELVVHLGTQLNLHITADFWLGLTRIVQNLPGMAKLSIFAFAPAVRVGGDTFEQVLRFFSAAKGVRQLAMVLQIEDADKVPSVKQRYMQLMHVIGEMRTLEKLALYTGVPMWSFDLAGLMENLPRSISELDLCAMSLEGNDYFGRYSAAEFDRFCVALSRLDRLEKLDFKFKDYLSYREVTKVLASCRNLKSFSFSLSHNEQQSSSINADAEAFFIQLARTSSLEEIIIADKDYCSGWDKLSYGTWLAFWAAMGSMSNLRHLSIEIYELSELQDKYIDAIGQNLSQLANFTELSLGNNVAKLNAQQTQRLGESLSKLTQLSRLTFINSNLSSLEDGAALGRVVHSIPNLTAIEFHWAGMFFANAKSGEQFEKMCDGLSHLQEVTFERFISKDIDEAAFVHCLRGLRKLNAVRMLSFSGECCGIESLNQERLRQFAIVLKSMPNLHRFQPGLLGNKPRIWANDDPRWQLFYTAIKEASQIKELVLNREELSQRECVPMLAQLLDLLQQRQQGLVTLLPMQQTLELPQPQQPERLEVGAEKIDMDNVQLGAPIGRGAFGEVFAGKYGGDDVALKKLSSEALVSKDKFFAEIHLLAQLRHPRIVNVYGYCQQGENFMLVMALVKKGSLFNLLHKHNMPLPQNLKVKFALDVALGIQYLHKRMPMVLHLDLKSGNILVSEDLRLKLADFGLSKVLASGSQAYTHQVAGTMAYMAPELFGGNKYSAACDIYSLAIVLWEIYHRQVPYGDLPNIGMLVGLVMTGGRPTVEASACPCGGKLLSKMWLQEPKQRLSIDQVVNELNVHDKAP